MRPLFAAFVLVPAAAFALVQAGLFSSSVPAAAQPSVTSTARDCDARCNIKSLNRNLRLDQIQRVGSAQSAKQRPSGAVLNLIRMGGKKGAQALDFAMPSLSAQLDDDARALSFDVAYDPKGGAYKMPAAASMAMELVPDSYIQAMSKPGFKVIHVLDVDYQSSCLALADCLEQVALWSRAHPRHLPLVIMLRTNDAKTPMPGATKPVAYDGTAMDALDQEIRSVFAPGQLFVPDQLQGKFSTLQDAVAARAWPKLGALRGKVLFVLDDQAAKVKLYQGARKSLEGRVMFVATDESSPLASFVTISDPLKEAGRIQQAVKSGLIVATRADEETREARDNNVARRDAAFASGAQIILTNFVAADPAISSYRVSLADNPAALCGGKLAPEHCLGFAELPYTTVAAAMP